MVSQALSLPYFYSLPDPPFVMFVSVSVPMQRGKKKRTKTKQNKTKTEQKTSLRQDELSVILGSIS